LRAIGSPAIASTVVDSNRDRPPDPGGDRALIHEFGKGRRADIAMPSDLNSVRSDRDVRPAALPVTNSPSSRIADQASLPAATSSRNSPASTLACSM